MSVTDVAGWQPGSVRDAAGGLAALTLATFVALTTELVPVGLLPQMSSDLDVTESVTGLLVTVYAFMVAALAIPLTVGTRRLPRKGLLLGTLSAYTLSNALVAIAPSFTLVAAGRALGGIAHALFFSLSIGYGARLVLPQVTGRALALVTGGATAGMVLGVPLSTTLGAAVGWRNAFLVLAAVCAVSTVLVAVLLPAVSSDDAPPADQTRTERRQRLGVVTATNALTYLAHYTVYTYVSVMLLATGLRESAVGPVLLGLGVLGLVGTAFAAASLDRQPRRGTLGVHAVMLLGLLALGAAFPSRLGVLVAAAAWCGAFGAMASIFQTAAIRTRGASPDIIGALVNTTANIGIGGGAAVGAVVLVGPGLGALPYVGAALAAGSLVTVLVARRSFPALTR